VSSAPTFTYNAQWNTPSQLRISIVNMWVPPQGEDVPADVVNRRFVSYILNFDFIAKLMQVIRYKNQKFTSPHVNLR